MNKFLFDRELKKLWNMRVTVIPIVVGALGTIPKSMEKRPEEQEIREIIETIQTTILPRSVKKLWRVKRPDLVGWFVGCFI